MIPLIVLSVLGIIVSAYATSCFYKIQKNASFKSICDLSDKASCSKAFNSPYGKHLGLPNGMWGIGFYVIMATLSYFQAYQWMLYFSIISVIASVYLAYLLITKVKALCLDCIAIYIINLSMLAILLQTL